MQVDFIILRMESAIVEISGERKKKGGIGGLFRIIHWQKFLLRHLLPEPGNVLYRYPGLLNCSFLFRINPEN